MSFFPDNFYLSGNKTATTEAKHCIDPLLKWDQNPFTLIEAKLLSFDLLIIKIIGRHRALLDVYQPDHSIFVTSYLISHIFVHNTRPQYM